MPQWEYRSVLLGLASIFTKKGWKPVEIDEQRISKEEKVRTYMSVVDFCNESSDQGWELVSIQHASPTPNSLPGILLYFKRLRTYTKS